MIDSKMENGIEINDIRSQFPLLNQLVNSQPLIYLDNAATTQKPVDVIESMNSYYREYNSNVHRGVHYLSMKATRMAEKTRDLVQTFINAKKREEIIFTSGTTESINLIAQTFGRLNLKEGDQVILSNLEHHSNIVPWQMICEEKGAEIKVIPINDKGELLLEEYKKLLSNKVKIVAISHASNALGTVNPIKQITALAHEYQACVVIDGAQAMAHLDVDVQDINCDFYCFSGHKMYGPTGIGALYGKEEILNAMPPYKGGGEMIKSVSFEKTSYNDLPYKFEAGTPPIAEIIGLGAAFEFLNSLNRKAICKYEKDLLAYATNCLNEEDGIKIYGQANYKIAVISFNVKDIHPFDLGTLLDQMGVAIRTGHHCTEPLMHRLNVPGTCRASLGIYNTKKEIDTFLKCIRKAVKILS